MIFAGNFTPSGAIIVWEFRVTATAMFYVCQQQRVGDRQRGPVHLGAADDEDGIPTTRFERGSQFGETFDAGKCGAGQDNVAAAWQWFTDGLVSPTAHDDRVSEGEVFESLKIVTDVPGDLAGVADRSILRHGSDDDDLHTATLNLIRGCGL